MSTKLPMNITPQEHQKVKDHLIIPVMLDYIQEDISVIQSAGLKTDLILINALKKVQEDILNEHFGIRMALKKSGIKVYSQQRTRAGIDAQFLCRGYEHRISLLWGMIRTEVLRKASLYTGIRLVSTS
ncbi:hypothetical protein [Cohnella sp.]|uniref:hypothetical protein n=1 Tax=Cohnella sp. TaxID=1883426 RepID=UPI00356A6CE6